MRGRRIDLAGRVFGNLTVLDQNMRRDGDLYWLCVCGCGARAWKRADNLLAGRTRSCGNQHKVRTRWDA